MFKKIFVAAFVLLSFLIICAKPKVAVLPAAGRGKTAQMAKSLSKEVKSIYRTVDDVELIDADRVLSPRDISAFKKCSTKWKCASETSKGIQKADMVLFPVVRLKNGEFAVTLYIFSTKTGKRIDKPIVKGEEDIDAEDLAADIGAALIDASSGLVSKISSEEDVEEEREERVSRDEPKEEKVEKVSPRERKNRLRAGFKFYKSGDAKNAIKSFREAGDENLAGIVEDIDRAIQNAGKMIKDGDYAEAVRILGSVESRDLDLREQGYKQLQFIKETQKKHKYGDPSKDDYMKVRNIFREIKKDIQGVAEWKNKEIAKLEDTMRDQLREKEKITRDFEKFERDQREKEKKMESDHQRKISDMRKELENLDSKYRDKIGDIERETSSLNKQLEDGRSFEEIYRNDIEKDQKELQRKYKKMSLEMKKALIMAQKKAKQDMETFEKSIEQKMKDIEKANSDLDKQIQALSKEIEKMNADFDRNEQKESQKFEKSLAANEAKDRKDRETLEKKSTAEIEALNKELEEYDKKTQSLTEQIDKIDREISDYVDKQDQRLQKIQENTDKKREELERKFDSARQDAENKAEQEYLKGQSTRAREIEKHESAVLKIEDTNNNYEKSAQWKKARADLKKATDTLVKYEDQHDKFIEGKIAPVMNAHKADIAKLDASFKTYDDKIKKEVAAFKAKKGKEKGDLSRQVKALEKGRKKFEAGIQRKIKIATANRDKQMKLIENRAIQRDKKRESDAKARRVQFDKQINAKRKQLAALEKQIAVNAQNGEKQREALTAQLEKTRIANEKKLSDMEIANEKKREQQELLQEKERVAVYKKYEQKAAADRKAINAKIAKLEDDMRKLLGQRGKEEATLRANIENAEKQTDVMQNNWAAEAKKRLATYDANIKNAEKREVAAKAKYEQSLKGIENQYKAKVEKIIQAASKKAASRATGKPFSVERNRTFEFSSFTRNINTLKADAYAARGMERLKSDDIEGARKDFFDALYVDSDSKSGLNGLNEIEKKAGELFDKAYKVITEDPDMAKRILIGLRKSIYPTSEYYLKTLALLEELKVSDE